MSETKIKIDYYRCGDKRGIDPRDCTKCLKICDPCVFLMHESLDATPEDPYNPQSWR
mgnify:CR=1 FL=1